jgi:hypothetical protein
MLLAGLALSDRLAARAESGEMKSRLFRSFLPIGVVLTLSGIATDSYLLFRWLSHSGHAPRPALAAFASSALVIGMSLLGFYVIYPLVIRARPWPARRHGEADLVGRVGLTLPYVIGRPESVLQEAGTEI